MAVTDSRRPSFAVHSTLAIVVGVIGWIPLVVSAALAMGSGPESPIALALGLAGIAAILGLSLAGLALRRGQHVAGHVAAVLATAICGVLGVVALVFAFSFHW